MTSVCYQSDQLLSLGGKKIVASPSTIFYQSEKVHIKTVQEVEEQLETHNFFKFVMIGQVVNHWIVMFFWSVLDVPS